MDHGPKGDAYAWNARIPAVETSPSPRKGGPIIQDQGAYETDALWASREKPEI